MIKLINDNCLAVIDELKRHNNCILVSDPPFNIGYNYKTYKDNMPEHAYYQMLRKIFGETPSVVIHYPESLYKLALGLNKTPTKVISWVYNSNTPRQHRDIAFFDVAPIMSQVTQPYKNPADKRIKKLIEKGRTGAKLYDWWNVNQVKNISKAKTAHPCQMPLQVMENIIGILPKGSLIIDPFMGSGTTGVACKKLGYDFIGVELDEEYFNIAKQRIEAVS
jgi:DNA modification methylase